MLPRSQSTSACVLPTVRIVIFIDSFAAFKVALVTFSDSESTTYLVAALFLNVRVSVRIKAAKRGG